MSYSAGVCNFCGTGCGHFLNVVDDRVVAVAPSVEHPVSQGRLCLRGWHIHELLAAGERIPTPMVRRGGALRPASYAEAIGVVRERLGLLTDPASQLGVIGSARSSNEDNYLLAKLGREVLGASLLAVSSQASHGVAMRALQAAFGAPAPIGSLAEIEYARYILVVGGDLTRLNPIVGSTIHKAARRGSRVVALSSTRTQTASLATVHLQQKPGTKRLAVNGLLKALVACRLAQPGFEERQLPGFGDLERALANLSPSAIEAATGIPYSALEDEARRLIDAESVIVTFPSGISGLDAQTVNSVVNVGALSGRINARHSGILPITGICNLQGSYDVGLVSSAADAPDLLARLGAADSSIRALVVVDHDDGVVRQRERIAALEFVAYVGSFRNPFMDLAHVVLPTATFVEDDATYTASDGRVQLSSAKVRPPRDLMPARRLYSEIAAAFGKTWNYASASDVFAEIARNQPAYAGLSHAGLSSGFGRHIQRPSVCCKRVLPIDTGGPAAHTDEAFPFALMIGKAQHFWHQHNLLRRTFIPRREYDATLLQYPRGYIEISAADAKKLQVRDKWMVNVVSPGGSMKTAIRIADVQDGSAYVPYFINEMISGFLVGHDRAFTAGEDAIIPIRIEKL